MKSLLLSYSLFSISLFATGQNVGIGTNQPANARFVVIGDAGNSQATFGEDFGGISIEAGDPLLGFNFFSNKNRRYMQTGFAGALRMQMSSGTFDFITFGNGTSNNLLGSTVQLMTITPSGNVGIGNSSPLAPLSFAPGVGNKIALSGNANLPHSGIGVQASGIQLYNANSAQDVLLGFGSSNSFTETFRAKSNGKIYLTGINPLGTGTQSGIIFKQENSFTGGLMITGTGASAARLGLFTLANNTGENNFIERLTISNGGLVGIGTTAPSATLEVIGNAKVSGIADFASTIQIQGGNPANGKVLTAINTTGSAVWRDLPARNSGFRVPAAAAFSMTDNTILKVAVTNNNLTGSYFDDGPNINNTSGSFIAPATGVYLLGCLVSFTFATANLPNSATTFTTTFFVNNANANIPPQMQTLQPNENISTWPIQFGPVLLKLNSGDAVSVMLENKLLRTINFVPGGITFWGYRLY